MGQRHQNSHLGTEDAAWLTTLIDTFERTEELAAVPCDAKTVAATMSRLQGRDCTQTLTRWQRRREATLEFHH
jgi:hypothetical protein